MSAKQLPLSTPQRRTDTYRGISITTKDCRNMAARGKLALELYTATPNPPRWIRCHPEVAAAIGAEVEGVMVIADGTARDLFLLGPIDI